MTMVLTSQGTAYDGSPTGSNDIYTATGPIVITVAYDDTSDDVVIYSRSDTVDYVETARIDTSKRVRLELVSGDQFYFKAGANTEISYVDV